MSNRAEATQAIRQTLAAYNLAGDRMKLDALAATFAEDGVLATPTAIFRGRSEIEVGLGGGRREASGASSGRRPTVVRHHLTTSGVDFEDAETASARSYFIVFTDIGPDHAGVYVDRLRKIGDAWLFVSRDVRIDWMSEQTLFPHLYDAYRARRAQAVAAKARTD